MIKKLLVCLIGITLLFSSYSCTAEKTYNKSKDEKEQTTQNSASSHKDIPTNIKNKIQGEIEFGTDFTNGLAFVKLKNNSKNYCIDKQGNIVFELDGIIFGNHDSGSRFMADTTGFYNDITLISDPFGIEYITVCDKNGKLTSAEQLGVSYFIENNFVKGAFRDGYIIAVVEGEKSKDDKVGILNSKLEWVIQPTSDIITNLGLESGPNNSTFVYCDYVLYGVGGSLDIKSGKFSSEGYRTKGKEALALDPNYWTATNEGYVDEKGKVVINVNKYTDFMIHGSPKVKMDGAKFINGKAPIAFCTINGWQQFSLIDTKGELLFNPVDFGESIDYIQTDGEYVFVIGSKKFTNKTAKVYDLKGNYICTFDSFSSDSNLQNGVIRVSGYSYDVSNNIINWTKYYSPTSKLLF